MQSIDVSHNQLSGPLPSQWSALSNLKVGAGCWTVLLLLIDSLTGASWGSHERVPLQAAPSHVCLLPLDAMLGA